MKLSHRDFRPQRRSKYVAQPYKRRPTLRILFLAAIGLAVYLKYDTVVNSKAFQKLRQPRSLLESLLTGSPKSPEAGQAAPTASNIHWSPDSAEVEAECLGADCDACLEAWKGLGREAIGTLRADLEKAKAQWQALPEKGFKARFRRMADPVDPLAKEVASLGLIRLEIREAKANLVLEPVPGGNPGALCARDRCLDDMHPQTPFTRFRNGAREAVNGSSDSRIPEARLIPLAGPAASPILRGRLLEMPRAMGPEQWVKIYHGGNTFSYYRGFTSLKPGLKPGSLIETGDTLGLIAAEGDSLGTLGIRIERNGMMVDPYAYLGLQPDTMEAEYAR